MLSKRLLTGCVAAVALGLSAVGAMAAHGGGGGGGGHGGGGGGFHGGGGFQGGGGAFRGGGGYRGGASHFYRSGYAGRGYGGRNFHHRRGLGFYDSYDGYGDDGCYWSPRYRREVCSFY